MTLSTDWLTNPRSNFILVAWTSVFKEAVGVDHVHGARTAMCVWRLCSPARRCSRKPLRVEFKCRRQLNLTPRKENQPEIWSLLSNLMLWFCLWSCLPGDSDDRKGLLSWSAEHDTCTAECIWMEVISLPPCVSLSPSLPPPPSLSVAVVGYVFCCRVDHGCHQRSQMKGGLYPHLCPSLLTPLFLSLPLSVISHPSPRLNNEQRPPPVPTNQSFYSTMPYLQSMELFWHCRAGVVSTLTWHNESGSFSSCSVFTRKSSLAQKAFSVH